MPAREGLAMKLFGTALFSLAVFSLCCSGEGPTTTTSLPPSTAQGTTLTLTTANTTTAEDSKASTTSQTEISKESLATSNGTTRRTGTSIPSLLTQSSVTATPNSSLSTTGQSANTTIRSPVEKNDTFSSMPSKPTEVQNDTGNSEHMQETTSHFSIIMPVIIALIVITLSIFLLISVYRLCWKTTPERQENGTEQTPSDKENVKLISVKTTSPESGTSEKGSESMLAGPLPMPMSSLQRDPEALSPQPREHPSQGKTKTRQHDDSSLRLGNKCV